MNTIICQECKQVIPAEDPLFALRINAQALCEACVNKIPAKWRIPAQNRVSRNATQVCTTMRNDAKENGFEIVEPRFIVFLDRLQEFLPNVVI